MSDPRNLPQANRTRVFLNVGAGTRGMAWLPAMLKDWRELRVDVEATSSPDILADITDLSAIESGSVDAVWSSHCLEHLYLHQVGTAIGEIYRVLSDGGFLCAIVPDLQAIAEYIANDRLLEVIYESRAGPVTAHDMLFGFGPYLAQDRPNMAHKCGFTPGLLLQKLQEAPFAEIVMRRRPNQELAAVASKRAPGDAAAREALLTALEL